MRKLGPHKGFSILMALGITAILMIVVTGLSVLYLKEFKISRLSYDEIISEGIAQGMFEYGMLKIRNHADGFADKVNSFSGDLDTNMFKLSTPRSEGMNMKYTIEANSKDEEFTIGSGSFLIIPLFIGTDDPIESPKKSLKPNIGEQINITQGLQINGLDDKVLWTISASDENGRNIGLQGSGAINKGIIQLMRYHCTYYTGTTQDSFESDVPCADSNKPLYNSATLTGELMYSYEIKDVNVEVFLDNAQPKLGIGQRQETELKRNNPYLILYNTDTTEKDIKITSGTPFALPEFTIEATASKGDASQVFKFSENKSRILDALKYGYYDPTNSTTTP